MSAAGFHARRFLSPLRQQGGALRRDRLPGFQPAGCHALKSCGVRRVVGVSALGRGTAMARNAGLVTASLAMDDLIASTGVSYRALDNMLRQAGSIRDRGSFSLPIDGTGGSRPAPRGTLRSWRRSCCSIPPGADAPTFRCSARRTCLATTWPGSNLANAWSGLRVAGDPFCQRAGASLFQEMPHGLEAFGGWARRGEPEHGMKAGECPVHDS